MAKNIYEVLDEFAAAGSKKEKLDVLARNWTPTLMHVLQLAYHPDVKWKIKDRPAKYKTPDTLPGVSYSSLGTEMRRFYLFKKGLPAAEKLTPRKREELFISMLESLEPREAEVVIGIFQKDLGVKGLTYKFVKECFPSLLP